MSFAVDDPASPTPAAFVAIKAVPGAARNQVSGRLGDRLKVRISAPPEGGKANKAICELLATELRLKSRDVEVVKGHTTAEKTLRISGLSAATILSKWA